MSVTLIVCAGQGGQGVGPAEGTDDGLKDGAVDGISEGGVEGTQDGRKEGCEDGDDESRTYPSRSETVPSTGTTKPDGFSNVR
mmetsp:Transcript_12860/g.17929  ORF Transcript_12860/g.17929 Transcript_12860/m.17929 type:complete len:83 (-) Transcript_12860:289-537(-)